MKKIFKILLILSLISSFFWTSYAKDGSFLKNEKPFLWTNLSWNSYYGSNMAFLDLFKQSRKEWITKNVSDKWLEKCEFWRKQRNTKIWNENIAMDENWYPLQVPFDYYAPKMQEVNWQCVEVKDEKWNSVLKNYPQKIENIVFSTRKVPFWKYSLHVKWTWKIQVRNWKEKIVYVIQNWKIKIEWSEDNFKNTWYFEVKHDKTKDKLFWESRWKYWLWIAILESEKNDHIREINIVKPGFENNFKTKVFDPEYINTLKWYSTLRFMNWESTNWITESYDANWKTRRLTSSNSQSKWVSYEHMIELANQVNADMWLALPVSMDYKCESEVTSFANLAEQNCIKTWNDEYVRNLAKLIKEKLNPNLNVYVEFWNELWNSWFLPTHWAVNQWVKEWLILEWEKAWKAWPQFQVKRSVEIWNTFEDVFWENDKNRIKKVIAVWPSSSWYLDKVFMPAFQNTKINPKWLMPDWVATTNYIHTNHIDLFENWLLKKSKSKFKNEVIKSAFEHINNWLANKVKSLKEVAEKYNIKVFTYEWWLWSPSKKWSKYYNDKELNKTLNELNRHPKMYDIYKSLHDIWFKNWWDESNHFLHIWQYGKYWRWWSMEYLGQNINSAPKYKFLNELKNAKAKISISRKNINFWKVWINNISNKKILTITNKWNGYLKMDWYVDINSDDFRILKNDCYRLLAWESCNITLEFLPKTFWTKNGNLIVYSSDKDLNVKLIWTATNDNNNWNKIDLEDLDYKELLVGNNYWMLDKKAVCNIKTEPAEVKVWEKYKIIVNTRNNKKWSVSKWLWKIEWDWEFVFEKIATKKEEWKTIEYKARVVNKNYQKTRNECIWTVKVLKELKDEENKEDEEENSDDLNNEKPVQDEEKNEKEDWNNNWDNKDKEISLWKCNLTSDVAEVYPNQNFKIFANVENIRKASLQPNWWAITENWNHVFNLKANNKNAWKTISYTLKMFNQKWKRSECSIDIKILDTKLESNELSCKIEIPNLVKPWETFEMKVIWSKNAYRANIIGDWNWIWDLPKIKKLVAPSKSREYTVRVQDKNDKNKKTNCSAYLNVEQTVSSILKPTCNIQIEDLTKWKNKWSVWISWNTTNSITISLNNREPFDISKSPSWYKKVRVNKEKVIQAKVWNNKWESAICTFDLK